VALSFLADEDFDNHILDGLRDRISALDIVRVQDVGLSGALDPVILDWAADHERIVVTHDVSTMTADAYARVRQGLKMVGVCVVPQSLPLGLGIDDLKIALLCTFESDWEDQVRFLPL
jgi:hypothetical protein